MTSLEGITAWGITCLCIGLVMIIGGIILLIVSSNKLPQGNKRTGAIVIGGILVFVGLGISAVSGLFIHSREWISNAPTASDVVTMNSDIEDAIRNKDQDGLSALFASSGYSGEALDDSDAEELLSCIDGNVEELTITPSAVSFEDSTHGYTFAYSIHTDSSNQYAIYIDYILASENEEYVGIQHIEMINEGETIAEFGTTPELENRS